MRKILSGMLGLIMTTAVVGGVAYAAFTTTGEVNGIAITAGQASLKVGSAVDPAFSVFNAGLTLNHVYPGFGVANDQVTTFVVKNTSDTGISLVVSALLTAADGWTTTGANLKNYVEVAVNTSDDSSGTGYHTLVEWNAGAINFPGGAITPGENRTYKVYVRIPNSAPNSIQGESLSNITFTLTGTQE